MFTLLMIACSGAGAGDTDAAVDPSAFLDDYAAAQCERLIECDEHFYSHFSDAADCEATLDEIFLQYQSCSLDGDGDACLQELAEADCEAVLLNDLPACAEEQIWECGG